MEQQEEQQEQQDSSNSTIDNNNLEFHGFDFTDASDSFQPDNNISDTFLNPHTKHKPKRKSRSTSNIHQTTNVSQITSLTSVASNSPGSDSSTFLLASSNLLTKVIGFQLHLLLNSVTFPIWLTYCCYMFIKHPCASIRNAKAYVLDKCSTVLRCVKSIVCIWIRKNDSIWKLCFQIGWGLLWSVYIGFILVSLLVFAFLVSGVVMKCILVRPVEISEMLSFDYTEDSPVAFVPLMSCPDPSFLECSEVIKPGEARVIPLDHKVYATVTLTLPESYYNRNLGVFQVRVDFLSGNGQRLASTRQPCMLRFKSLPIRLMLTFLKIAPLVTGYSSESQKLDIKFRGYTERTEPTSCLRVILEQRAEFTKGAGIPEIYEASLKLESQPPFLKRILWYWKGTIYIWVSIMMFVVELLFTLLCCTPILVPWVQPRGVSVNNIAP